MLSQESIGISQVADYLKPKLIKPKIIDPALYLDPGTYPVTMIPYPVKSTEDSFTIDENTTYKEIELEDGESYYLINNNYKDEKSFLTSSHNNNLRLGFGRNPIYSDSLYKLPIGEMYGKADDSRGTWWEECQNAARLIKEKYQDVALLLSGGLDSELVACAFLEAGLEFRPYFMKYFGHRGELLNSYDWEYVQKFCNENDLILDTENINIVDDICDYRHLDYHIDGLSGTHFPLSALYTHNYAIEKFNKLGFAPVFGNDGIQIKMDENGKPSLGLLQRADDAAVLWAHEKNYHNVYNFFAYTPNLILSYIDIPEVKNATDVGYDLKKHVCYKYGSNRLLKVDRSKSTGYEKMKRAMRRVDKQYHNFTFEIIDKIDWSKRPTTQYIHNIDHILEHNEMCQFKIIRVTTRDLLYRRFAQSEPDYYDL